MTFRHSDKEAELKYFRLSETSSLMTESEGVVAFVSTLDDTRRVPLPTSEDDVQVKKKRKKEQCP